MGEAGTVSIIGGGMAGLCAGCYLQMNGYQAHIYELHALPGGLCTSWKRGDYTFDGCIHWLMGSRDEGNYHRLWNELVDLGSIEFYDHPTLFAFDTLEHADPRGGHTFTFHSDLERLGREMKEISPADARTIDELVSGIRSFQKPGTMPPMDRPRELRTFWEKLKMVTALPVLLRVLKWSRLTNKKLARRFESPFLREVFDTVYPYGEIGMLGFMFQIAFFDAKLAGYPIGGSLAFAQRFADRFASLGGRLHYQSRVDEILAEGGRAVGVRLADGTEHRSDYVISAADGHWTLFEGLGGKYLTPQLRDLYAGKSLEPFPSLMYVSLGVSRTWEGWPSVLRVALPEPLELPDGSSCDRLGVHLHYYDATLAPEGHTTVTLQAESRQLDYWRALRSEDRAEYKRQKQLVAMRFIEAVDERLEGLADHVELIDVATPATWHRYTNNWQGSYEGWLPPINFLASKPIPKELPGLERFFMIGQWINPGGGLPPALTDGRHVAQIICHRERRPFRVVPPSEA